MQRMYDNLSPEQQGVSYQPRGKRCEMDNGTTAECEWKVSRVAIDRAMSIIRAHSAKGLDEIPPGLMKRLGQIARETLVSIFTCIINDDPIPEDWRRGKVCLVPKRGGNSDQLHDYRPLTVTSVLYRLFTQAHRDSPRQPLDGKSAPVNFDDLAHDDHNEPRRQEQGRAPPERPRIHTNMKEVVDRSRGELLQELGTTPNSPGETRQVGVRQEDNLQAPDNTMDLSAMGKEAPPRPNDVAMKQERRHSKGYAKSAQASRNTHSQILLVGDGNVPRVARALQRQLGPKQNLQTCWTQHATVKRAQKLLHQYIGEPRGEAGRCHRLVVLLVGATDAIRGTRPEDVVEVIRDSVTLYAERLVTCSVPEAFADRGSEGRPARPQTQHPVLLRHPQPGTTKHPQEPTNPQKTEPWAKVSPVGLLFPETRSNDVIPQAVQPQQSPPWQDNIQPPYLTQPIGVLPIGLDLARMIADMVQHYMRQQHPQ
ncbi:hypothetical protein MRX96_038400 [Rhipicephalus microplus]